MSATQISRALPDTALLLGPGLRYTPGAMSNLVDPPNGAPPQGPSESHQPIDIEDEMRQSYLDYAMSVIIGRALPDVRDGLKPVHRRVLFAMHELSNTFNRPYKKSARVVGDVVGKYHPHGESAIYEAVVRLAQDFSMRHVLVDGQGNFGSVDGDPPAAMRYTEVRMTRLAGEMLADIDKDTVDFVDNYDGQDQEPSVLPTRFPNLLINGSSGIAVGMATNIPPHNLGEVIDATIALIADSTLNVDDLMKIVKAPDFPTAGIIYGTGQLRQAYETGRGVIKIRGRARIEEWKTDRDRIVIDELPYQVNKASLIERIAEQIRDKRIEGISDIRDESSREGMRVVIELRRDVSGEIILNQLYRNTALQSSFGMNMVAIVQGRPRVLGLKEILQNFISHRQEIVTRRSRYELRQAQKRFNVVFGLLAAIDSIDRVIEIIRAAPDAKTAKTHLMAERLPMSASFSAFCERLVTFEYEVGQRALKDGHVHLNEAQAQAILDMRLARLTGLAREELEDEADELRTTIQELLEILGSEQKLLEVIVEELKEIRERYADARRTTITQDAREMSAEDLIADEEMIVTVSHNGYVKRNPTTMYRAQRRGGRGKTAASTRDEDFVENIFVASTHSYVLVFTDKGRVYWLKVHEIPQASRAARGKPIINLIRIQGGEKIAAVMPVRSFEGAGYVVFVTSKGYIKKTELSAFSNPRPSGLIALSIDEGDALIRAALTQGDGELLVATRMGMAIRFKASDVRPMGRTARGVRALNLKKDGDAVVGMAILDDDSLEILTVSELGYGKRTQLADYRVQGRGGSGIINMKLSERTGEVASARAVHPEDEIMVVTNRGMMIRTRVDQISTLGRSTQGVRVITMRDREELVSSVERVAEKDGDE